MGDTTMRQMGPYGETSYGGTSGADAHMPMRGRGRLKRIMSAVEHPHGGVDRSGRRHPR